MDEQDFIVELLVILFPHLKKSFILSKTKQTITNALSRVINHYWNVSQMVIGILSCSFVLILSKPCLLV